MKKESYMVVYIKLIIIKRTYHLELWNKVLCCVGVCFIEIGVYKVLYKGDTYMISINMFTIYIYYLKINLFKLISSFIYLLFIFPFSLSSCLQ